ncbi:MAG: phosphotransferase family protein, partial [Kofleriaceae bacterium]
LITEFAPGTIYADELREVARAGAARPRDLERTAELARYLAALHQPLAGPSAELRYHRAIRDLVGSGEGIFGMVDGYAGDVPAAPRARIDALEQRCVAWRSRLRAHTSRLVRTHGDFHPFNIVCRDDGFALLDASRGTCGDPADDVTALAINYLLFALDAPAAWPRGLGPLWHGFWDAYRAARPDALLTAVAPPFFAWRALVVCNPRFYPALGARGRDALLGLVERALDEGHLEPAWADELFR